MSNDPKSLHNLAQQCVNPPYIGDREAARRLQARYLEQFRAAATPEAVLALTEAHEQVSAEAKLLRPVVLDPKDLRIDPYSKAEHPGWTYKMTTGVRIIHLPTGLEAISESERSQHANRGKALAELEKLVAANGAQVPTRVPAGFYRELEALRELRDAVQNFRERYLLDEIDDPENCVSAQHHQDAKVLDEKLDAALFAAWPGHPQALHEPEPEPAALAGTPAFEQMTRDQLSAWYITNVGYDLGAEDPDMSLAEFQRHCREMHEGHAEG